jgi:hypothetical protein
MPVYHSNHTPALSCLLFGSIFFTITTLIPTIFNHMWITDSANRSQAPTRLFSNDGSVVHKTTGADTHLGLEDIVQF